MVRWLSQAVADAAAVEPASGAAADDGAGADREAHVGAPQRSGSGGAKSHASGSYRVTMLRALRERQYEDVLNEYDNMVAAGVTPDALTLNCVVEAKAQHEGTQQARETLKLVLSQHPSLRTTAHTYVALMRPSEKTGDKVTAFELYNEALEQQITPHIDLFNSLIGACSNSGDWAAAEAIFDEMREKARPAGFSPCTCAGALSRCATRTRTSRAHVHLANNWARPCHRNACHRVLSQRAPATSVTFTPPSGSSRSRRRMRC